MNDNAIEGPNPTAGAASVAGQRWRAGWTRILPGHSWHLYVALIYSYLYLCMFRGGPFIAYDHVNYINFLNDPIPFLFEPGYTAVAYAFHGLLDESVRFPAMFLLWTAPPVWIVWKRDRREQGGAKGMMLFACVLTKAFYIGFITQRFFFAELWVAALIIHGSGRNRISFKESMPGLLLHFSTLSVLPSLIWLRHRFTWRKLVMGCGLVLLAYGYLKLISGFQLFGYDYSRYLDPNEQPGGFPVFSVLEMVILGMICHAILPRRIVLNFVGLVGLILLMKMLLGDIEVFSRVFQVQVDIVMVMAGLRAYRRVWLLYLFGFGFLLIQLLFTPGAQDMFLFHSTALLNALQF